MPQKRNDLRDRAVYGVVRAAAMLVHTLPVDFCMAAARCFGRIWYRIDARHSARSRANLHNSFPDLSGQECDRIARRSVENLFMLVVEILFTTRLIHIESWRKYIRLGKIQETLNL